MAMHRNTMANFFYLNEDTSPYEGAAARRIKPGHPIIDVRFFTAPPPNLPQRRQLLGGQPRVVAWSGRRQFISLTSRGKGVMR
jgi:hypothetical protein